MDVANWMGWSLTRMTVALWQYVSAENEEMRKVYPGFYRGSAQKTKWHFDPRQNPIEELVMRHNGFRTTCQTLAQFMASSLKPSTHRPLNRYPLSFEPSSPELWTINPWAWNCHPIGPSSQEWRTHVVKGATEEDKNIAWRALLNGPDGSMSVGR